jgi:hypothetical protein
MLASDQDGIARRDRDRVSGHRRILPLLPHARPRRAGRRGFAGKKEPYDAFRGQRYANVTDPDGNVVDLFAPL